MATEKKNLLEEYSREKETVVFSKNSFYQKYEYLKCSESYLPFPDNMIWML